WSSGSASGSRTSRRWSVCLPRHLPDRADQVVEVVRFHHGGLAALLEKTARLVARAVAGDEHEALGEQRALLAQLLVQGPAAESRHLQVRHHRVEAVARGPEPLDRDRKSTRLNSSHVAISYAVFCLKKKKITKKVRLLAVPSASTNQIQSHR